MYYTDTGKLICPLQTHLFPMSHHHPADEKKGQLLDFFIFLFKARGCWLLNWLWALLHRGKKVEIMRLICWLVFVFRIMADQRVVCWLPEGRMGGLRRVGAKPTLRRQPRLSWNLHTGLASQHLHCQHNLNQNTTNLPTPPLQLKNNKQLAAESALCHRVLQIAF